ncbi:MAG: hypothetical protein IPI58_01280 [Alphaproteobacteria bacterium]|nr:MAG: hypothetical protein IPI58_01280 [Alphaproteobacteria bacterium]
MTQSHAYSLLLDASLRPEEARLLREALAEIAMRENGSVQSLIERVAAGCAPDQDLVVALRNHALAYYRQATPSMPLDGGFNDGNGANSACVNTALRALELMEPTESP